MLQPTPSRTQIGARISVRDTRVRAQFFVNGFQQQPPSHRSPKSETALFVVIARLTLTTPTLTRTNNIIKRNRRHQHGTVTNTNRQQRRWRRQRLLLAPRETNGYNDTTEIYLNKRETPFETSMLQKTRRNAVTKTRFDQENRLLRPIRHNRGNYCWKRRRNWWNNNNNNIQHQQHQRQWIRRGIQRWRIV